MGTTTCLSICFCPADDFFFFFKFNILKCVLYVQQCTQDEVTVNGPSINTVQLH